MCFVDAILRLGNFHVCRGSRGAQVSEFGGVHVGRLNGSQCRLERAHIVRQVVRGVDQTARDRSHAAGDVRRRGVDDDATAEAQSHKQELHSLGHVQSLARIRSRSEAAFAHAAALAHGGDEVEEAHQKHRSEQHDGDDDARQRLTDDRSDVRPIQGHLTFILLIRLDVHARNARERFRQVRLPVEDVILVIVVLPRHLLAIRTSRKRRAAIGRHSNVRVGAVGV